MQRFPIRLALAALVALALSLSRAAAADGYIITDLGALPGMSYSSVWQQTINNAGVVAAYANSSADDIANSTFIGDSSYLWMNGQITSLPGLLNATDTVAFSLNNHAQVVGRSTPSGAPNRAVLWDQGVIQALGELPGDNKSAALNLNDRAQIVGYSASTLTGIRHAVLWHKGTVSQLPPLPGGGMFDEALGINGKGQIVGYSGPASGQEHIALWYKGVVTDLGTLGGAWGWGIALNNKGQIVGLSATASGGPDPCLWDNGVLTDLGVLPGDVGGAAVGINKQGQVVGTSGTTLVNGELSDVYTSHAVLWQNGDMIDLQTQIPADSGWTLTAALGINDRGQIVGQGVYNGNLRAVLLTPASALTLYATNFEYPPFLAGLPLVGQDGWTAPDILSPNAALISTDKLRQGQQSVRVWGGDLQHQDFINSVTGGYYDAIGSYRRPVEFDTGGTQLVRVAAHVRIDGPLTPGANFFSASVVAVGVDNTGSSNGIGELVLSSDGHVYGDSDVDLVPTFLVSAPITLGQWHTLAIEDDFAARTYSFFVDGQFLGTFAFDPSITSNIFRRGSLLGYVAPDTASLQKGSYTAHYDHFSIKVVHHDEDDD